MYVRYSECIKDTCYFFWDTFYMRGEREIQILNIFIRNTKIKKKTKQKTKKKIMHLEVIGGNKLIFN